MRRTALISALLAAMLCTGLSADRITSDPNRPGANTPAAGEDAAADESEQALKSESDPRLAQLVTYEAANRRLHRVVSEISAATGVGIRCGRSAKDWQVRDLPMTLYVKDLPLDVLIRAIADATHMIVTTGKLDGVKVYQITHNTRLEKRVQDYQQAKATRSRLDALRTWDENARLKDAPKSAFAGTEDWVQKSLPLLLKRSELLALLGPSVRDRVVGGDRYALKLKDATGAVRDALEGVLRCAWQEASRDQPALSAPTAEDLEESFIRISCTSEDSINFSMFVMQEQGGSWQGRSLYIPDDLRKAISGPGLTAVPEIPQSPETLDTSRTMPIYTAPHASKMVNLEDKAPIPLPEDRRNVTYAQALIALAKHKGVSLVCEDFVTYSRQGAGEECFRNGTDTSSLLENHGDWWFADDKSKLLLGFPYAWIISHESLVPEALLSNLETKLNGDGVGFEDYIPLYLLTRGQFEAWIWGSREIDWPQQAWTPLGKDAPLWRIYASLGAEDKALANSEGGLPLTKLDPAATLPALKDWCKTEDEDREQREMVPIKIWDDDLLRPDEPGRGVSVRPWPKEMTERVGDLADPAVFSTVTMRIVGSDGVQTPFPEMIELAGLPKDSGWKIQVPKKSYRLEIAFEREGDRRVLQASGPQNLPIYSRKREAEVLKELAGKGK